jgi:excisionase family DNA binding protein
MSKAPPAQPAGPRYMTLQEVADELGLKRTTIYTKIYDGDLVGVPVGKNGRGLRVLRSSFDEYCQRKELEGRRRFGGAA